MRSEYCSGRYAAVLARKAVVDVLVLVGLAARRSMRQTLNDLERPVRSTSASMNACWSRTTERMSGANVHRCPQYVDGAVIMLTTETPSEPYLERRKVRSAVDTDAVHESRPSSTWNEMIAPRDLHTNSDGQYGHGWKPNSARSAVSFSCQRRGDARRPYSDARTSK